MVWRILDKNCLSEGSHQKYILSILGQQVRRVPVHSHINLKNNTFRILWIMQKSIRNFVIILIYILINKINQIPFFLKSTLIIFILCTVMNCFYLIPGVKLCDFFLIPSLCEQPKSGQKIQGILCSRCITWWIKSLKQFLDTLFKQIISRTYWISNYILLVIYTWIKWNDVKQTV